MKVIDLFAGVGGLSAGFVQAGFEVVYANEYDPAIAASFQKNHPCTIVDATDIRQLNFESVFRPYENRIDVVMGGPPCQGFSQKGKRIGLDDERNFLFRQFVEVVRIVKPRFILLENVPNILSAENGYFKQEIIDLFARLGYDVQARVLKAEEYGVPQKRRRAVFLGQRGKLQITFPADRGVRTTVQEAIGDLPRLRAGGGQTFMPYPRAAQSVYQLKLRRGSDGIWNHIATKHSPLALERLALIPVGGSKADLPVHHHTKSIHSGTWSRLDAHGLARTITTRFDTPSSGQFTLPDQNRCITVREAARLQSFADNFIFIGSKSSQMTQIGNAVPPLMAETLALEIKRGLAASTRPVVGQQVQRRKQQLPVAA